MLFDRLASTCPLCLDAHFWVFNNASASNRVFITPYSEANICSFSDSSTFDTFVGSGIFTLESARSSTQYELVVDLCGLISINLITGALSFTTHTLQHLPCLADVFHFLVLLFNFFLKFSRNLFWCFYGWVELLFARDCLYFYAWLDASEQSCLKYRFRSHFCPN